MILELKPCPFCGGEVSMALTGQGVINWLFITRGNSKHKKNCSCRLFMKSDIYFIDRTDAKQAAKKAAKDLVEAWNRRVNNE